MDPGLNSSNYYRRYKLHPNLNSLTRGKSSLGRRSGPCTSTGWGGSFGREMSKWGSGGTCVGGRGVDIIGG